MTGKIKEILDTMAAQINSETTSRFVRHHLFSDEINPPPCRRWSYLNQFMTYLSGTMDARGIRQWEEAGRSVRRGAKPLYILVPMLYPPVKVEGDDKSNGKAVLKILKGFRLVPVFRVEDTTGAPLDYEEKLKVLDIEALPLIEVAKALGVTVEAGLTFDYVAVYRSKSKKIILGTANKSVFLHELSHAVDFALPGRNEDYAFGEVVAELSAAFLGSLFEVPIDIPSTKAYIQKWSGKGHVAFKLVDALQRVEEIYRFIEHTRKKYRKKVRVHPVKSIPAVRRPGKREASAEQTLFTDIPIQRRSQTYNPHIRKWVKRDDTTGLFRSVKKDGKPFKRIVREKSNVIDFPIALYRFPDD
jgi:hypothetical protein